MPYRRGRRARRHFALRGGSLMPKKRRAARSAAAKRTRRGNAGKVVLTALALCLLASGLTWAGWGRLGTRYAATPYAVRRPAPPAPLIQGGLSQARSSKEYA